MSNSVQTVVSNGSLTLLDLSINYFDRSHIKVAFDTVEQTLGTTWSWVGTTDKKIQFTPAVESGVVVQVKRQTPLDAPRHVYSSPGNAPFNKSTVDENFLQGLYAAQEAAEGASLESFAQDVSAAGYKLTDLGDAMLDGDAISLKVLREYLPYGPAAASLAARITAEEAITAKTVAQGILQGTLVITGFDGTDIQDNAWVNFAGRDTIGDGGGGPLRFLKGSTATANGVTVYAVPGGRLVREGWSVFGINVRWAGAKGDGVADDAPACNAAHAAANAVKSSVSSGYVTAAFSQPPVHYPHGKYRFASTVSTLASDCIRGDRAIILPDAGVTAFETAAYQVTFDGVVVLGGGKAIRAATGNVDSCKLDIVNSEFQNQTIATFETDATSNSTIISVTATKIQNSVPGAMIGNFQSGDRIVFGKDVWIASGNTLAFQLGTVGNLSTGATLVFDGAFLVPYSSLVTWVKANEESNFFAIGNTRFGGEPVSGSSTIVETHQSASSSVPTSLVIADSTVYCSGPVVKFYGIPNVVVIRNNAGMTLPTNGLYFDSGITEANLSALKSVNAVWDVEQQAGTQFRLFGSPPPMQHAFGNSRATQSCNTVLTSDKALQIPINSGGFGTANSTTGITNSAGTNVFGAPVHDLVVGATPSSASYSQYFNTALSGFAAGTYTAVFDIENVTGEPIQAILDVAQNVYRRVLLKGKNVICVPFYYTASGSQVLGLDLVNWLAASQRVKVGSIRLFYGAVTIGTQNTVMYGSAAPSGSLQAEVGDRVINPVPAAGQPKGWGCSVRGAPGTWISEGNW